MRMNGAIAAVVAVFVLASVVPARAQETPCKVTAFASQVGGLGGAAAGAVIGQAIIPVPVLGGVLGSLIGGLFASAGAGAVTAEISGADQDCIWLIADTGPVPLDGSVPTQWRQMQEYASVAFGNPTAAQLAALDEELSAFAQFERVFKANRVVVSRQPEPVTFLPAVVPVPVTAVNSGAVVHAAAIGFPRGRRQTARDRYKKKRAAEKILAAHPIVRDAFIHAKMDANVQRGVTFLVKLGDLVGAFVDAQGNRVFVPAFLYLGASSSKLRGTILEETFDKARNRSFQTRLLGILLDDTDGTLDPPLQQDDRYLVRRTLEFLDKQR